MKNRNISELTGTGDFFTDDEGAQLSTAQLTALEALLDGKTQDQAANRSEKWLWHQMNSSGMFREVFTEALNSRHKAIRMKAVQHADSALDALVSIAKDPKHKDRLKACQAILSITTRK